MTLVLQTADMSAKPLCLSVQHHTLKLEETFTNLSDSMILKYI